MLRGLKKLNKDSKILIAESCSHNISHEDIGRVKIPRLLNKRVGYELKYDFMLAMIFLKILTNMIWLYIVVLV